ncbi:MAG TPA: hypothetical protein PKH52_02380 [bacterium]|nr:hypothetical protein [bacterium]
MKLINPTKVLYIKLGGAGAYEEECINENKIMIDYKEIDHNFCLNGEWNKVEKQIKDLSKNRSGWGNANNHLRQLKDFYESGEDILWITFCANKLWWCFAENKVYSYPDGKKYKKVVEKWRDTNIENEKLLMGRLSGKLLKTQGYQGTICNVEDGKYVINKINNQKNKDVETVETNLAELKSSLANLIKNLWWDDFEVLIDLIFHNLGWKRVGALGKTQKSIDLELSNPLTNETIIVQIKSKSSRAEFDRYREEFKNIEADRKYYIVNSSSEFKINSKDDTVKLYFNDDVADLVIKSGLIDWVINKAT